MRIKSGNICATGCGRGLILLPELLMNLWSDCEVISNPTWKSRTRHTTRDLQRGLQDPAIMISKDCVRKGWRWSEFHEVYILNLPSSLISLEVKDKSVSLSNKICYCSVAQSHSTLCNTVDCFFTISWSLFKLMSIASVMPSNHLIPCHPLFLPSIFPSIRVFSNELTCPIRWPK